jgi:hypothetical protein
VDPTDSTEDFKPKKSKWVWEWKFEVPWQWQQYVLCLLFHLAFPLLPLFFESILAKKVTPASWHLVAFTYGVSVGGSSRSPLNLGIGFGVALIFAVFYGAAMQEVPPPTVTETFWPKVAICFVAVLVTLERYRRHVTECAPFWEFVKGGPQ